MTSEGWGVGMVMEKDGAWASVVVCAELALWTLLCCRGFGLGAPGIK